MFQFRWYPHRGYNTLHTTRKDAEIPSPKSQIPKKSEYLRLNFKYLNLFGHWSLWFEISNFVRIV